jgi:hypothetical protein
VKRLLLVVAVAGGLVVGVSPAGAVPRHVHMLTTPNDETHAIAGGVTFHAPCQAFLNFHEIVHTTVFGISTTQKNPLGPLGAVGAPGLC